MSLGSDNAFYKNFPNQTGYQCITDIENVRHVYASDILMVPINKQLIANKLSYHCSCKKYRPWIRFVVAYFLIGDLTVATIKVCDEYVIIGSEGFLLIMRDLWLFSNIITRAEKWIPYDNIARSK